MALAFFYLLTFLYLMDNMHSTHIDVQDGGAVLSIHRC